jgi:hypothetical protein
MFLLAYTDYVEPIPKIKKILLKIKTAFTSRKLDDEDMHDKLNFL